MKLIKTKDEIVVKKDFPGLINCEWKHKIKESTAQLVYGGPPIAPEVWHQILSFFRWTNSEHHSESQVRLYVNPTLARWGAWAFPQEARTGMTAKEIDTVETEPQAGARFAHWGCEPSGDWIYFGTVHHHCSCSAFQSGTDEHNERNQDGLHLTVGNMDSAKHSLHARFTLAGTAFEPDLALFWNIGEQLRGLCPPELWDSIARHQMTAKVEVEFPQAWRANVIEIRSSGVTYYSGSSYRPGGGGGHSFQGPGTVTEFRPRYKRLEDAAQEVEETAARSGVTYEELQEALDLFALQGGEPLLVLFTHMADKHDVSFGDLLRELGQENEKQLAMSSALEQRILGFNGNNEKSRQAALDSGPSEPATGGGSSPLPPDMSQVWQGD